MSSKAETSWRKLFTSCLQREGCHDACWRKMSHCYAILEMENVLTRRIYACVSCEAAYWETHCLLYMQNAMLTPFPESENRHVTRCMKSLKSLAETRPAEEISMCSDTISIEHKATFCNELVPETFHCFCCCRFPIFLCFSLLSLLCSVWGRCPLFRYAGKLGGL